MTITQNGKSLASWQCELKPDQGLEFNPHNHDDIAKEYAVYNGGNKSIRIVITMLEDS